LASGFGGSGPPWDCFVSVCSPISPSCGSGQTENSGCWSLSAAACAAPIDLCNCRGTAISPYLLAVLFVKSICGYFSRRTHEGEGDLEAMRIQDLAVEIIRQGFSNRKAVDFGTPACPVQIEAGVQKFPKDRRKCLLA
jgi:hypothetical protein